MSRSEGRWLVLADAGDGVAASFVARHHEAGARLVVPADLSRAGWAYRVGDAAGSVAMVGGERCAARAIRGVVTRLSGITPAQLPHVAEADRGYVAAEMSAFLLAWLTALPCPVMNRPLAPSLSGPSWRWEQWAGLAQRLGMAVAPSRRSVPPLQSPAIEVPTTASSLTVVGTELIGSHPPGLARHARRLADAAGVSLLELMFDGDDDDARLCGVNPWPDLTVPAIAAALIAAMR